MPREYKLNRPAGQEPTKPSPSSGELTDESMMPFGKYGPAKGDPRKMSKVPPAYLLFMWDGSPTFEGFHKKPNTPLHRYIKRSFKALMQECPDYIAENMPERE